MSRIAGKVTDVNVCSGCDGHGCPKCKPNRHWKRKKPPRGCTKRLQDHRYFVAIAFASNKKLLAKIKCGACNVLLVSSASTSGETYEFTKPTPGGIAKLVAKKNNVRLWACPKSLTCSKLIPDSTIRERVASEIMEIVNREFSIAPMDQEKRDVWIAKKFDWVFNLMIDWLDWVFAFGDKEIPPATWLEEM